MPSALHVHIFGGKEKAATPCIQNPKKQNFIVFIWDKIQAQNLRGNVINYKARIITWIFVYTSMIKT